MLRNFGTQDGELYKPDTMEIGGNNGGGNGGAAMPDMGNIDMSDVDLSQFAGKTPPSGGSPFGGEDGGNENGRPSFGGPSGGDGSFDPNDLPADFDPGDIPADFDPSSLPEGFDAGNIPEGGPSAGAPASDGDAENGDGADAAAGSGDGSGGRAARSGAGGGFSKGGGANLNYTDDDLDSYSTIWESEVTGTSKGDHRRVVTALKNISEGTDLETYLNVDNVLKYMAVHTFSVNMDSLSGSMAHNYYLYEYDGQLNIIPWDYNLSFGGMSMGGSGDATHMVNDAIDTPFSGTKFFDALLEDETYLAQYHAYLQQLTDAYVNGGRFDETYTRIRSQIDALVETDPTAFYDYDEYQTAAEMLYETVKLRAESISGQLAGTIPSTDAGQRQDASAFVDASGIDVTAMGQLNMGASFESRGSDAGEDTADGESGAGDTDGKPADTRTADTSDDGTQSAAPEEESAAEEETTETATQKAEPPAGGSGGSSGGGMPGSGGFDPNNMPDMGSFDPGNMPDMGSFDPGNMPDMGSFDPGNMPDMGGFGLFGSSGGDREDQPENEGANGAQDESGEKTPGGGRSFSGMPGSSGVLAKTQTLALYGVSLVIILAALFAAVKFKRRKTA
ncbi:MAG: CotH kinase family protein [Clostridia bacterium]|nr:CotH kinase family protein [Clostridia bacterium]